MLMETETTQMLMETEYQEWYRHKETEKLMETETCSNTQVQRQSN